jgi:hypothetical protein
MIEKRALFSRARYLRSWKGYCGCGCSGEPGETEHLNYVLNVFGFISYELVPDHVEQFYMKRSP